MSPSVVKTTSPISRTPASRLVTSTRTEEPGSGEQLGDLQRAAVTNLELISELVRRVHMLDLRLRHQDSADQVARRSGSNSSMGVRKAENALASSTLQSYLSTWRPELG